MALPPRKSRAEASNHGWRRASAQRSVIETPFFSARYRQRIDSLSGETVAKVTTVAANVSRQHLARSPRFGWRRRSPAERVVATVVLSACPVTAPSGPSPLLELLGVTGETN